MRRIHSRILGTASFAALAIAGFSTPAFAQDEDAPDGTPIQCAEIPDADDRAACVAAVAGPQNPQAAGADEGDITVTGSRIRRPNLASTVPITSVGTEEILDTGNLNLGDALSQLPSLRGTFTQANSTRFIGTAGINRLDLRGLGTGRTLVLVNGRRHVTSEPGSTIVDINTIPNDLLERVDIVTGGNSAIYGSDAVSGVVNFILRRDYDGFRINAQGGISERGDRGSYFVAGIWGQNFADDRANFTFAAEYSRTHRLMFADRPEQTGAFDGQPGFIACDLTTQGTGGRDFREGTPPGSPPQSDDVPDTCFLDPGTRFNNISLTGFISTACPLPTATNAARRAAVCTGTFSPLTGAEFSRNYLFTADGSRVIVDPIALDLRATPLRGGPRLGGLSATGIEDAMLAPGFERVALNGLFNVELSSIFQPFAEAKFVYITANQQSVQPTFANGAGPPFSALLGLAPDAIVGLNSFYSINNPFLTPEARNTILTITGISPTTGIFQSVRFNNDVGTRAEDHQRETWRFVAGFRGDLSDAWNYEVSGNYGRTETYYETGGNVHLRRWANATNAVRNSSGAIVCGINADASTANDDPACVPFNAFGFHQASPAAVQYVLHTSTRDQWAEQLQLTAFVSGDTSGFFELPGGPIGVAAGVEYRTEDAFSAYDPVTSDPSAPTFLNAIGAFDPPTQRIKEAFGELRIPILRDMPFFNELSVEAAARVSDYNTLDDLVWAYNVGLIWSPVPDIRFRGGYARAVRAPDLGDLFSTASQTFQNALQDPCDQTFINSGSTTRAQRCAEAGIPTTITLPGGRVEPWTNVPGSGVRGISRGNPELEPEIGTSWTVGAVIQPRFLPGFALTVDYHNIEIEEAIASLTGQQVINRCYDDPVSLDNPFCAVVFRRSTPGDPIQNFTFLGQSSRRFPAPQVPGCGQVECTIPVLGDGFVSSGFNFQRLRSEGIDFDLSYRRNMFGIGWDVRAIVSWLINREFFTFISDPTQSERIHGLLGDPEWAGALAVNADFGEVELQYDMRFLDRMQVAASWETQNTHQGRGPLNADAFPFSAYPRVFYHDFRVQVEPGDGFRFYAGVDNAFDRLPPFGLTGTGAGSGIYSVWGRYFYAGVRIDF